MLLFQWVIGDSSDFCRQTLISCSFIRFSQPQNNWLITQYISRDINRTLLPQVNVQIDYEFGCSRRCKQSFVLAVWETSRVDRVQARNTSNYRNFYQVSFVSKSKQVSIPLNFTSNKKGFYLALIDDNTCVTIHRVMVFFFVCPAMIRDLVIYPETLAPPIAKSPIPQIMRVEGECVAGAYRDTPSKLLLRCTQGGHWDLMEIDTGCQQNPNSSKLTSTKS